MSREYITEEEHEKLIEATEGSSQVVLVGFSSGRMWLSDFPDNMWALSVLKDIRKPDDVDDVDVMNSTLVSVQSGNIKLMRPLAVMPFDEALVHAAWVVALVGDKGRFDAIYERVCNT